MASAVEWTTADSIAAAREGWGLFGDGEMLIERLDDPQSVKSGWGLDFDPPQLEHDGYAWRLVRAGVADGSPLHCKAYAAVSEAERGRIWRSDGP